MTSARTPHSLEGMTQPLSSTPARVVIAGGGVAALEALIALRELAGDRVRVTLLAPEPDFVYRPLEVAEPFCLGHAAHHPLADIVSDFGAELVAGTLEKVDPVRRSVTTSDGATLSFDSLLVAVGARSMPVHRHAITFGADGAPEALAGLLADLQEGYAHRVAFVVPSSLAWSLPLYELAIITARHVWGAGIDDVHLTFVTPEARALELFGPEPSAMVADLLAEEGIEFIGSVAADVVHNGVDAGGRRIDVDRVLTLPVPAGPAVPGLPNTADGFIPVDEHGLVEGLEGVYAAGDATDSPIKQGGLAGQQAVAAAERSPTTRAAALRGGCWGHASGFGRARRRPDHGPGGRCPPGDAHRDHERARHRPEHPCSRRHRRRERHARRAPSIPAGRCRRRLVAAR